VVTLRQNTVSTQANSKGNELFGCAFTVDCGYVLTGGWDGRLRLWEADQGTQVAEMPAGTKPLSACAASPDGTTWLSGSMDGMLAKWDAQNHEQRSCFLAHTRPISGLVFAPDGAVLATTSWDRQVILWNLRGEREGRTLAGHNDIVAGCAFTPDALSLISWSYDKTIRLWDVARARCEQEWIGHQDRVTAGGVSPDGRWFASGGRDRLLKLWDLREGREVKALLLGAEIRACFFLLDAESLLVVDANGRLTVHNVPTLSQQTELTTRLPVQCAQLSPSGAQVALGCSGGELHLVQVDGFDNVPLAITATQTNRSTASMLHRVLGMRRTASFYRCTCPACRQSFELPAEPTHPSSHCPNCRRHLRVCAVTHEPGPKYPRHGGRGKGSGVRRR